MTLGDKPAFPGTIITKAGQWVYASPGMTLREFYAGLAMMGHLANDPCDTLGDICRWSVNHADALLAELEKTKIGE